MVEKIYARNSVDTVNHRGIPFKPYAVNTETETTQDCEQSGTGLSSCVFFVLCRGHVVVSRTGCPVLCKSPLARPVVDVGSVVSVSPPWGRVPPRRHSASSKAG